MSDTLRIKLDETLEYDLNRIVQRTSKSKSFIVIEAIKQYIEDIKDIEESDEILRKEKPEMWTLHDEVKKKYMGNKMD